MPTAYRTCPLCEATCGLEVTVADGAVSGIRGDRDDVFSRGYVCPKGAALKELHEDDDRVRTPLLRRPDGSFAAVTWDEAFAEIARRLPAIVEAHGRDAVAAYIGNPTAHNLDGLLYGRVLLKALGTKNLYSASTVDQFPKQMASAYLFGSGASVAVPDLDRTDFLLMLGANPLASNGSLMTAPDMRGRLRAIRARGGRVVVVDPRRTRTAREADEHHFIRPGTDALLLMALVHVLFEEDLVDLGALAPFVKGLGAVREVAAAFAPEAAAAATGIEPADVRRLARSLADAPRAVVYGRIGTTTQAFGTTASWLVDVLNALTGNLDREGGAMWPLPAAGSSNTGGDPAEPGRGRGARFGRWASRVRGLGEIFGELPVACLAEEIDTPGDGRVRALITFAGNPAVSTPNAARLEAALETLELMVSVDIYVNETTRHADVILPAPSPLERSHFDVALYGFAVRNVANFSPALFERPDGMPAEWQTLLRLTGVVAGQGPDADVAAIDDFVAGEAVRRAVATAGSAVEGRDADELLAALAPRVGPERLLDLALRTGPYGDGFGAKPRGLTLAAIEAAPHGVDLGPLAPRLPEVLRTPDGLVDLAPEPIVADVERLHAAMDVAPDGMVLVGRRDQRSNNSWMHNLPMLVRGKERCTAWVHPDDAGRLGLADGELACVSSRAGSIELPVEVTDDVMPGVVSIPHGWGHGTPGAALRVAARHAGANSNVLADETLVEPLSGTAMLNGIPVELAPVRAAEPAPA
ncbi:MAG TPA: molybdopterin-dependent oxidoreductase [Solirubrobacteraceae bacterium]|nr:molybdopterin-dependent oxidoreductase [Solirubrobacteraceae bacterium]